MVYQMTTNGIPSIGKDSIDKNSVVEVVKEDSNSNNNCFSFKSVNFYKNNINPYFSEYEQTTIMQFINNYGDDLTERAIQIAIERNNKNLSYIAGILKSWKQKDITTVQETICEKKDSILQEEKANLEKQEKTKESEEEFERIKQQLEDERLEKLKNMDLNSPAFNIVPQFIKDKILNEKENDDEIEM